MTFRRGNQTPTFPFEKDLAGKTLSALPIVSQEIIRDPCLPRLWISPIPKEKMIEAGFFSFLMVRILLFFRGYVSARFIESRFLTL